MKILYLNPVGTIGGAEMCLLDVLAMTRAGRPDWRLGVVLGDDGPLRQEVAELGVPCTVLPLPGGLARMGDAGERRAGGGWGRGGTLAVRGSAAAIATASYLARLRRVLRAEAPDRLQTNGMKAHVLGAWAAPRTLPVIWHLHDYLGPRPVMARLLKNSARRRLTAVAVSQSVAADASRVLGARIPVRTIYNAVDLERFAPGADGDDDESGWLDEACGLPRAVPGTVRVGLVATFAVWKGHDVFLEAIARMPMSARQPCRFYIVGGPIYRSRGSQVSAEELRARATALGLPAGRLGFAGHQADPARAIRALDVVVHASTRPEPFGRVIVEGMACGRAVVAIDDGGAHELFEDGVTALGCPPRDPDALARAIARLVDDAGLRRRLGCAGRNAAIARFDRQRLTEEWTHVYQDVGL